MSERKELFMRIIVAIVTGVILYFWSWVVGILIVLQFIYVLFFAKRHKGMADFCNLWLAQYFRFSRYMIFETNTRPFPFSEMSGPIEQFEANARLGKKTRPKKK